MHTWAAILAVAYFAIKSLLDFPLMEDAYIYLRYAQNLAEGYGLVYNPGEHYDSATNFLLVALLALPFALSIDPFLFYKALSHLVSCMVIVFVYLIVFRLADRFTALLAMLLMATHWSFIVIGHTGFMPHLPAMLALAALYAAICHARQPSVSKALAIGISLSLLSITRLDAQIPFAAIGGLSAWFIWRQDSHRLPAALLACMLPVAVFAAYLLCKYIYYGDFLPNTYHVKMGSEVPEEYGFIQRGLLYNWMYLRQYAFLVFIPVAAFLALQRVRKTDFAGICSSIGFQVAIACTAVVVLQVAYMFRSGGIAEEFRFHVITAPFIFILLMQAMRHERKVAAIAAVALINASALHAINYQGDSRWERLAIPLTVKETQAAQQERQRVQGLASFFSELFPYPQGIKIATTAGGLLPFRMRMHVIEMHGFADPRILEEGNHFKQPWHPIAGHQFMARPDFLLRHGANIIFGHPRYLPAGWRQQPGAPSLQAMVGILTMIGDRAQIFDFPADAKIIEIPMSDGSVMLGLYAIRDSRLDELFARKNVRMHDL